MPPSRSGSASWLPRKPEVREGATAALREAGRSAVRPLQAALQSEDAEVRSRARELLEERGRKQEVEKSLKKLADDLRGRLRKGTVHVDYDDIELGNIAQSFSTMESARIFVSPALRDRRVTLKARGVTTERLFELLAESVEGNCASFSGRSSWSGRARSFRVRASRS
jgi:hypothetical protein